MEPKLQTRRFRIEKLEERIAPTDIGGTSGVVTGSVTTAVGVGGCLEGTAAAPSGVSGHIVFGSTLGPQPGPCP